MARHEPSGYEVHLTDAASADLGVETPVRADAVDFYDSGVWVSRGGQRVFYPYERVLCIHEGTTADEQDAASESTDVKAQPTMVDEAEAGVSSEETGGETESETGASTTRERPADDVDLEIS